MVHCPDCGTTYFPESEQRDVKYVDMGDDEGGFFTADKKLYLTVCAHCGAVLGAGAANTAV